MPATFTWTIANLERNTSDDGVTVAHWRCDATETVGSGDSAVTHTASSSGTTSHTPDSSDPSFIAYASLTEADVLGWVHAQVTQAATEAALQAKIDEAKAPTTASGKPW